ncbi:uncharacterized protein LOC127787968 isoform X2 [Diospyros lotus]|uniref:uncharacterized protein LOC127787968 isoform X2 n=1 Tax=Diospyros lotus TaxID=55363 RepID=UPI00224DC415|nr:uncharacterized protein LOC127787968 isoform X2 [Diospyros lotus]
MANPRARQLDLAVATPQLSKPALCIYGSVWLFPYRESAFMDCWLAGWRLLTVRSKSSSSSRPTNSCNQCAIVSDLIRFSPPLWLYSNDCVKRRNVGAYVAEHEVCMGSNSMKAPHGQRGSTIGCCEWCMRDAIT